MANVIQRVEHKTELNCQRYLKQKKRTAFWCMILVTFLINWL